MGKQLSFWDLQCMNGKIYFSNNSFNALFEMDEKFDNVTFLGSFPGEKIGTSDLHKWVFSYEESLFFVPFFGKAISEYIPKEKQFNTYIISGHDKCVSYSSAYEKNNCIYFVASDTPDKAICFDMKKKMYTGDSELSKSINETKGINETVEGTLYLDKYDVTYKRDTNVVNIREKESNKSQEKVIVCEKYNEIRDRMIGNALEKKISRCFYEKEEDSFLNLEDFITFADKRESTKRKGQGECGKIIWDWIRNNM